MHTLRPFPPALPVLQGSLSLGASTHGAGGPALLSCRGQAGRTPSAQRCWGWSWDPGSPSFKATGSLWGLSHWLLLGSFCSPARQLPPLCPGLGWAAGGSYFRTTESLGGAGGGRRRSCHSWRSLPPPTLFCSAHPADTAAGEWASTLGGGRGGSSRRGLCPLPALRHFSTKDTSQRPQSSPGTCGRFAVSGGWHQQEHRLSQDASPVGEAAAVPSCPLSHGSRWLGLLSHRRTHRTTLSVSPARVNGALSGPQSRPSWRHEWGTQDGGGSFLPDPRACCAYKAGVGAGALEPQQ